MTDKKRRQRGSRTRGGGTHKNRRGAGNRGGRGEAGRKKHNFHGHEPLGKYGFKRPPEVEQEVREVDVRTLDENAPRYVESGLAGETEHGYRIDAREIVDDGYEADAVKVLGNGQVRRHLEVTADAFSDRAIELIEAEGGDVVYTERSQSDEDDEVESHKEETPEE